MQCNVRKCPVSSDQRRPPPVLNKSMWNVDPLQIGGVVLWYAEEVQVVALLVIADLKHTDK